MLNKGIYKTAREHIMEAGLAELLVGITAGAFSPIALIAAWQMLDRTRLENRDPSVH